ncbi:hypothetical protein N9V27_01750 [bacterium]|nr:hypothetical protein [bacterium]
MDMRNAINIVEADPAVGTIPASGTTPVTASVKPTPPAKGSAARKQEKDAAQDQSALPGGKEDPNAVELDKDNGLDKGTLDAIEKAGVTINVKEADINSRDDIILRDILANNQEAWNNFKEGNDITDNDHFYQQLVSHFISTDQLSQDDVGKGVAVERITGWLDTLANNVEVVEMDDNDFEKYGDEADKDEKASDGDRKNADKNVIMQIRRAADGQKPTKIFVDDGEVMLDPATARKVNYAFDNVRPQAKGQVQGMLQNKAGLNDIIKMVDGKTIPEATSTVDEVAPLPEDIDRDSVKLDMVKPALEKLLMSYKADAKEWHDRYDALEKELRQKGLIDPNAIQMKIYDMDDDIVSYVNIDDLEDKIEAIEYIFKQGDANGNDIAYLGNTGPQDTSPSEEFMRDIKYAIKQDHPDVYSKIFMPDIGESQEIKEGTINEGTMTNDVDSDAFTDFLKTKDLPVGPDPFELTDNEEEMVKIMKMGAEDKVGAFFFDDELWDDLHQLRTEKGADANAMPLIVKRAKELFVDESVREEVAPRSAQEIRQKELELQKLYKTATVKDLKGAKDLMNRTKSLDRIKIGESYEGATAEEVADAIKQRMFVNGMIEKALEKGQDPQSIMLAIEDVGEFHAGAEELGSSDISIMAKQVMQQLGGMEEAYIDDTQMDSIYEAANVKPKLTYEDVNRALEEGNEADVDMAHELIFQGDNDADLYRQQFLPIIKNLMRKRAKGIYEPEKAVKLWRYWIDNVVKKHAKELGIVNTRQISGATRNLAAKMKSEEQFDEMELGNWDDNKSAGTAKESVEQVNEAEMYKSLEDVYPAGPTEIWFWKQDNGRDFMMGMKWLSERGVEVTQATLQDTHVKIGTIAETNPEKVYGMMQGENWSPEGEARELISKSGSGHTSMSVGDVLVIGGKLQMVDRFGFVNPEDEKEVSMAESTLYSPEKTAALITDRIFEETKNAK